VAIVDAIVIFARRFPRPFCPPLAPTMTETTSNPLFRISSIYLVALSLSIGWGIRGDFGHESGAWIPGALSAIAICLLSRREDWQRRVAYCALFGGLGWGFGGSISYMWPMTFAGSGQWESIWYGFFGIFLIGGLWAGMGGAGTALPLSLERDELNRIMKPFLFVLVALIIKRYSFLSLVELLKVPDVTGIDGTWGRHKNPLYWFDADWLEALFAGVGICLYDLWDRRGSRLLELAGFSAGGTMAGWGIQRGLENAGLLDRFVKAVVIPMGDPTTINPDTQKLFDPENMLNNWPQFFSDYPQHVGWLIGLILGIAIYFRIYGRWSNHSGLFAYMVVGWYAAFLAMPVFGSIFVPDWGGFRLTPPRGDNWAGCLGVLIGTIVWALRNNLGAMAFAGTMNFVLGGIAFATAFLCRNLAQLPGHHALFHKGGPVPQFLLKIFPSLVSEKEGIPPAWQHYQSANWHSVLEQSQGFGHGLITLITFGLLWRRMKTVSNTSTSKRYMDVVAVILSVFMLTYVNVVKNPAEWTKNKAGEGQPPDRLIPEMMKAPFFEWINLSAETWFNLAWFAAVIAFLAMLIVHLRRPIAVIPPSWQGKGQLIYLMILWIMVLANFERSMNGFGESRLVTEWLIFIHGAIATFLILVLPRPTMELTPQPLTSYVPLITRVLAIGLPIAACLMFSYSILTYRIFGQPDLPGAQYRWGPKAEWRIKPILKNSKHR